MEQWPFNWPGVHRLIAENKCRPNHQDLLGHCPGFSVDEIVHCLVFQYIHFLTYRLITNCYVLRLVHWNEKICKRKKEPLSHILRLSFFEFCNPFPWISKASPLILWWVVRSYSLLELVLAFFTNNFHLLQSHLRNYYIKIWTKINTVKFDFFHSKWFLCDYCRVVYSR